MGQPEWGKKADLLTRAKFPKTAPEEPGGRRLGILSRLVGKFLGRAESKAYRGKEELTKGFIENRRGR